MSSERIWEPKKTKFVEGHMETEKHVYTAGIAGEKFLRGLKEGKIIASRCNKCDISYLPARSFCEECFSEINEYYEIETKGEVDTYTIQYTDENGEKLEKPIIWAIIKFYGVRGGILHKLGEVDPEEVYIGMVVEPVFKPEQERKGSIEDIQYFKPVQ